MILASRITEEQSTRSKGLIISRRPRKSVTGICSRVSGPSSAPMRPKRLGKSRIVALSRLRPSSSGRGEGQVRMRSTQEVSRQLLSPASGIMPTGSPSRGRRKYQGREGLFHAKRVTNPARYSTFGSAVRKTASKFCARINSRVRSTREWNSASENGSTGRCLLSKVRHRLANLPASLPQARGQVLPLSSRPPHTS